MTDIMIQNTGTNNLDSYTSGTNHNTVVTPNVYSTSSSSSSSCEETESVCSESSHNGNAKPYLDNDLPMNDEGEVDDDNLSVSSKAYSSYSMSEQHNLEMTNRRKQKKPIRINEELKTPKKESNELEKTLKSSPHLNAQLADYKINLKLEQVANLTPLIAAPTPPPTTTTPKTSSMETFCTICKKEVCSKYFLKTHLLNKHNMQIEDYYASLANQVQVQASSTGSLSSASSLSSNSSSSASSTSSIYENTFDQQLNLTQKLLNSQNISSLLANPTSADLIQKLANLNAANSPKAPNHAIPNEHEKNDTDNQEPTDKSQTEAIMSLMNLSKQQQQPDSTLFNHYFNMAMRQQQQHKQDLLTDSLNSSPAAPSTNSTQATCDLCHKQFCNKYYLKKHIVDVHGVTDPGKSAKKTCLDIKAIKSLLPLASGDLTNGNNLTQILLNQLNPLMQIANTQLAQSSPQSMSSASSSSIASAASSLKLPIQNTVKPEPESETGTSPKLTAALKANEVKCIHCTKVFFSAEFLALHIQNKHGIKQDPPLTPKMNPKANIESPLLANQPFCEYCNKSFCNKYFLRTHMNKAHGKTLIIENSKNEPTNSPESSNADPSMTHHFASKVVDRVVCDICNKQVCNKYFLRTHKLKVHGLGARSKNQSNQNHDNNTQSAYNGYIDGPDDNEYYENDSDNEEGEMNVNTHLDESVGEANKTQELGELVENNENVEECASDQKSFKDSRRESTCSNNSHLSILTTSSTHAANKVIKSDVLYTGASPISSTSSFSLNSPSYDLTKLNHHQKKDQDSFCTLCNRQFCTKYILKKHMIKQHPEVFLNNDDDEGPIDDSHVNNESANEQNITLSAMSRVKCMLCEKELCNKYFLRQHVQNVHKIVFNEYLDKYGLSFSSRSPRNSLNQSYYSNQQLKLKKYILEKNKKIRDLHNAKNADDSSYNDNYSSDHSPSQRKRKFSTISGDISQGSCDSYETISSSSNTHEKRHRSNESAAAAAASGAVDEEGMFSTQLLKLTNAAEEEGFSDLQAFIVESDPNDTNNTFTEHFRPSMIYLPVKSHLNDSITIRVRLRPVGQSRVQSGTATSEANESNVNNPDDESFLMNYCVNEEDTA